MAPVSSWVAFLVTMSHCCPKTAAWKGDAQKDLATLGNSISKMNISGAVEWLRMI